MMSLPDVRKLHWLAGSGLVVMALCLALLALPAQAIEQGGIGGRPAYPRVDNPRSQSIFVHTLKPGGHAKDGIQVINNTPETRRVLVYAVDSQLSSGGSFACAQAADKPLAAGQWIALAQQEILLGPGAKQIVDFNVRVPKDAAPGEHDGCIVVQDTKQQSAPDSNGIVLSLRSAIRIAITVPGHIQKGLAFTGLGLEPKGEGKLLLSTRLMNSGNVSLDTQLDMRLAYPWGMAATRVGGNFPVLSDSQGYFNFESDRPFWGGWYRLTATASYNDDPNIALGEGRPTATISRRVWVYINPNPWAMIIEVTGVCLLVGGLAFWLWQRRHYRHAKKQAVLHTVESEENLHTIAERYGVPWRRLARFNKLKPPYQLKTGQQLMVVPPSKAKHKKQSRS